MCNKNGGCCCCRCLRKYLCCCFCKKKRRRGSVSGGTDNEAYSKSERIDVNFNISDINGKQSPIVIQNGKNNGPIVIKNGKNNGTVNLAFKNDQESDDPVPEKNKSRKSGNKSEDGNELKDIASFKVVGKQSNKSFTSSKDNFLSIHNELRSKHNAPSLEYSSELNKSAQVWAEHLAATGSFKHDSGKGFGENLFNQWSSADLDIEEMKQKAVQKWYDEIEEYSFANPGFKSGTGHFTQVVWKASTQLGLGIVKHAKNGGTEIIVVGRYLPAGNVMRRFEENVLPPNSGKSSGGTITKAKNQTPSSGIVNNGEQRKNDIKQNNKLDGKQKPNKMNESSGKHQDPFLSSHNVLRSKHNALSLEYSSELNKSAQTWAEHLAATGSFKHDSGKGFGENLFNQWSSADLDIEEAKRKAVEDWYNEIEEYSFSNPGFKSGTGHFTQVVWKASTQLGLGIVKHAKKGGTEIIVVGRYLPAGNVMRRFEENVLPPR